AESGGDPLAGQPTGTGAAAALRVDPPAIYLLPSEVVRASPRALRDDGSAAAPVRVTWRSLREDVATVDQNGNIVALASGQGTIQITGGGLTATAPVVVQQADFTVAEPGPILLSPGDSLRLHVIVPIQNNRLVSPVALQWSSSNPGVARVNLLGFVAAAGPGRATLSVTGLLQTRTVEVTVHRPVEVLVARPPPRNELTVPLTGTQRFEVQGLAADNTPVPEAPMRWSVADSTIAMFNPATGLLTGRGVGKTQLVVRAPGQGLSVTWTVNVVGGSPRLTTTRAGLALGERLPLRGDYVNDSGTVIGPATNLSWASDRPEVATVADDGTVSATGY
ncbi:MAG: Ig-like domain-containing protein, partial [Acidimicrobiales bacterium]